jgi:hypothetical protein
VYKPGSVTRQGLADEPIMRDDEAVIEHADVSQPIHLRGDAPEDEFMRRK